MNCCPVLSFSDYPQKVTIYEKFVFISQNLKIVFLARTGTLFIGGAPRSKICKK
jgi:hypothetical protein